MMKTLILHFYWFIFRGGRSLDCHKFFFQNIKMRPKYNKKCYNHWFFCRESSNCNWHYVDRCDTRYRMSCVTFNLACVFVLHDRSSTAFSFGRFRSVCIAIPFLHLRFAGILARFFGWFLTCTVCDKLIMSDWHLKPLPKHTLLILIRLQFEVITESGKNPPNLISSFTEIEIFSDCPHKNSLETRTFYPIPSKLCHNVEQ
jgi:hypothetical protein